MERKRLKILYLTNRVPYPPNKGDRIRTFHQIDRLALHHDVYCATFTETHADAQRVERLRRWCREVITVPFLKRPAAIRAVWTCLKGGTLTHGAYLHPDMTKQLARWNQRIGFDVVICFSSIMAPYVRGVAAQRKILDLCDVDSAKWNEYASQSRFPASRIYKIEATRLAAFEQAAVTAFNETIVITSRERRLIDADESNPRVHVVSNGVRALGRPTDATVAGPVVGFLGTMNYRPNIDAVCWFADRVWPKIRHTLPNAQFLIIGREPTRTVRQLAEREGIVVTGGVSETHSWIQKCRVVAVPLRVARGLPNKMLEAMAAGRPVVASSAAAACIDAEPNRHFHVADEPEDFADRTIRLLCENRACHEVAREALTWVRAHHDWEIVLDQFERVVFGEGTGANRVRRMDSAIAATTTGTYIKSANASVCP